MTDASDNRPPARDDEGGSLIGAAPGLARIAASAWWRTTEWALGTSLKASTRLARAARTGESPAELFESASMDVRRYVRDLLELVDGDGRPPEEEVARGEDARTIRLREQGADLLRRSADINLHEDTHPAYARILGDLAPDEGRILRLLALEGPQAAVDVRTARPFGIGSELVEPGINMLGSLAGCRYPARIKAYLNTLHRLGLIWFSREELEELAPYQVLEAQPEVTEARNRAGRGRIVRRSIHLTPFGEDFCETVLPLHTEELESLPGPGSDHPDASIEQDLAEDEETAS
jgi:hypothetical protein